MSWFWRGLVVLLLALPVGAYVTGSLAGTQGDLPDHLDPVVVEDPSPTGKTPTPAPSRKPDREDDDRDDRDERDDVVVVRPDPDDLDDASDDDGRDLDDPDDDVTDDD